jgi:hypothetical protein
VKADADLLLVFLLGDLAFFGLSIYTVVRHDLPIGILAAPVVGLIGIFGWWYAMRDDSHIEIPKEYLSPKEEK